MGVFPNLETRKVGRGELGAEGGGGHGIDGYDVT